MSTLLAASLAHSLERRGAITVATNAAAVGAAAQGDNLL
jgi:hypothetical protein